MPGRDSDSSSHCNAADSEANGCCHRWQPPSLFAADLLGTPCQIRLLKDRVRSGTGFVNNWVLRIRKIVAHEANLPRLLAL